MKANSIILFISIILLLALNIKLSKAQVENVFIYHPIYDFLLHLETRGLLPHYSHSDLPLQRNFIVKFLEKARSHESQLTNAEKKLLRHYEIEFNIVAEQEAVVFYSDTDSLQLFSKEIISQKEKFIYRYDSGNRIVNLQPLGEVDIMAENSAFGTDNALVMNYGGRLYGSLDDRFGYFLQATNGSLLSGSRDLVLQDQIYSQNIKFSVLESDIDFTESHATFQYDWFRASMSRESRQIGSGLFQNVFHSDLAPPVDAIVLGVQFETFAYKFMHSALVDYPDTTLGPPRGFDAVISDKYMAMHRFSIRPSWGEISFWESVVYSDRNMDLGYLIPISFYKSLEHAKRDRDNSIMGIDWTIRPIKGTQLKGSFLLDDIKFEEIGKDFWSNKTAFNSAVLFSYIPNITFGIEYARVEPYTFSHFKQENSFTNDGRLIGSYLQPNSEQFGFLLRWFFGYRYPFDFKARYMKHGRNEFDENGNLVKNVGGDPLQSIRPEDPLRVTFLDGDTYELIELEFAGGIDIFRGFNLQGIYQIQSINSDIFHNFRLRLRFGDF